MELAPFRVRQAGIQIAEVAYGLLDKAGEIDRGDLVALLQDAAAMEVAAGIVDMDVDPAGAAERARGCQMSMGLAEAKSEARGIQGRLNEATEDVLLGESTLAKLSATRKPEDVLPENEKVEEKPAEPVSPTGDDNTADGDK